MKHDPCCHRFIEDTAMLKTMINDPSQLEDFDLFPVKYKRKIPFGSRIRLLFQGILLAIAIAMAVVYIDRQISKAIISDDVFPHFKEATYWTVSHGDGVFFSTVAHYEAELHFSQEEIAKIVAQGFEKFDIDLSIPGVSEDDSIEIRERRERQSRLFGYPPTLGMDIPIATLYPLPRMDLLHDDIYFSIPEDPFSSRFAVVINATKGIAWVSYTPGL